MKRAWKNLNWYWILGYVFVVGAVIMMVEMAAFRLYTPVFGGSIIVWGSIIGVVMAALAAGYWQGGSFIKRGNAREGLVSLGFVAAGYIVLVPLIFTHTFPAIIQMSFPSMTLSLIFQSLLAALLMFGLPIVCLGAVTPLAVHLVASRSEQAGTETGRIYALSTAGSIVGTFVATFFLLPFFGTDETIIFSAVLLVTFSVLGLSKKIQSN